MSYKYLFGKTGKNGELLSLNLYIAKNKTNIYKQLAKKVKENTAQIYGISEKNLDYAKKNISKRFNSLSENIDPNEKILLDYIGNFLAYKSKYKNIDVINIPKVFPSVQKKFYNTLKYFNNSAKQLSINTDTIVSSANSVVLKGKGMQSLLKSAMPMELSTYENLQKKYKNLFSIAAGEQGEFINLQYLVRFGDRIDTALGIKRPSNFKSTVGIKGLQKEVVQGTKSKVTPKGDNYRITTDISGNQITVYDSVKFYSKSDSFSVGSLSLLGFGKRHANLQDFIADIINLIIESTDQNNELVAAMLSNIALQGETSRPLYFTTMYANKDGNPTMNIKFMYEIYEALAKSTAFLNVDLKQYSYEVQRKYRGYDDPVLNSYQKGSIVKDITIAKKFYQEMNSKNITDYRLDRNKIFFERRVRAAVLSFILKNKSLFS